MAAWGRYADHILEPHKLEDRFGETSPLARLYALDAQVLFLGTTYDTNTCFHLAEYRRPDPPTREFMIVREIDGEKTLVRYMDVDTDSSIFETIGTAFSESAEIHKGTIGQARCQLFQLRSAVDFAQQWLTDVC